MRSVKAKTANKNLTKSMTAAPDSEGSGLSPARKIVNAIRKAYGKNIASVGTATALFTYIPSGVFAIDYALMGGIPETHITELIGYESSGKTTSLFRAIARSQIKYPESVCALVYLESLFDKAWAEKQGVDLSRLVVVDSVPGETAVDSIQALLTSPDVSLVGLDSLPALLPVDEKDDSAEDSHMALQAKLFARCIRKTFNTLVDERNIKGHKVSFMYTNQYRSVIGKFAGNSVGKAGGFWSKHGPSVSIACKSKVVEEEGEVSYNDLSFVVEKSKIGLSVRSGMYKMFRRPTDDGFLPGQLDEAETVWKMLKDRGVITGAGKAFRLGEVKQFYSKENVLDLLRTSPHKEFFEAFLVASIRKVHGLPGFPPDNYLSGIDRKEFNKYKEHYGLSL